MADVLRIDPLSTFNFYITLIDTSNVLGTLITAALNYAVAGFSECSGIDATLEIMDYREGGVNDHVHKFATRTSYSNLTLKHGVIYLYDDLWTWHYEWVRGSASGKMDSLFSSTNRGSRPKFGNSSAAFLANG